MSYVLVVPRIRFRAWDGTEPCEAPLGEVVDLREALEREYRGDACIVQYAPPDVQEAPRFPRLTKAALSYFELSGDDWPRLNAVLVDVDYGEHEVPPDGWAEKIVAQSPWPCGWYRTPHGLRLVYEPKTPVAINYADSYLAQFHAQLRAAGIPTDEACEDWTRLLIAPKALDRDLPYDFSAIAPVPWHPETLARADAMAVGPIVDRDFQTAVDCAPDKITHADLKPLGASSRLARLLYKGQLSAPEGKRHATLLDAAREIVAAFDTDDPLGPFYLLLPSAQAMRKDISELWRVCEWVCAHHSGVKIERAKAAQDAKLDVEDAMGVPAAEAIERVVIDAGNEFFVWDEERLEYSTGYGKDKQLLGALSRHAPNLSAGYYEGKGMPTNLIMRDLSTVADRLVFSYKTDAPVGYDKATYTFYRRICKPDRSIRPAFDPDVDRWLRTLLANELERGLDWLACLPNLDRPLCAFYLCAPHSVGKGMLPAGAARIWSRECATTPYAEVLGTFNPTLKRSPIILADEKVPQDAFQANDSSVFRRVIGNSGIPIRDLNKSPVTLDGYPRVMITANNEDALAIREELTQDDLEAIRIRIGYIEADDSAGRVLRQMADEQGFASTREMTESWVAGGRIAAHILWLSENREVVPGHRFLVEGWDSELTRSLSTSAGSSGAIAEVLAILISENPGYSNDGIKWYGGNVYVNNSELGRAWRTIVSDDAERPPNSTRRVKALRALSGGATARLSVYNHRGDRRQLSYWKIDAEVLARLAAERNICPREVILERAGRPEEVEPEVSVGGHSMNQLKEVAEEVAQENA